MRSHIAMFVAGAIVLAGCGGGGDNSNSFGHADVTGVVYDQNGGIVRDAQVFYNDLGAGSARQTVTNSNGAYVLKGVPALDDLIQCQLTSNGVQYFGQNLARLYDGQRTMTVNIGLYPESKLASIHGTVSDNHGNLLIGAKIFAIPDNGTTLSSSYGITDNRGNYFVGGLLSGIKYDIQVNGLGYSSALDTETLNAGQDKPVNYTLTAASITTLAPPSNVRAIAYTTPAQATTQIKYRNAFSAIRSITNPGKVFHPTMKKFVSGGSNAIEVDVMWSPITDSSLLGFGIYRGANGRPLSNVDFLRDPLSEVYEDMDGGLTSGTSYTYAVTTVSTSASNGQGESNLSASATVTPLGPLALNGVAASTHPTFSWSPANGAVKYSVLLFDQYPDIGVLDIFDTLQSPTQGTSYQYNGNLLSRGITYYYVVIGYSSTGDQSVSQVGQFTVP